MLNEGILYSIILFLTSPNPMRKFLFFVLTASLLSPIATIAETYDALCSENDCKIIINQSFNLDCGKEIRNFPLAYETYGTLNKNKNNAILAFHALTGDQFCTNINPITKREGWWTTAVGS